jgi:hypothetical protein
MDNVVYSLGVMMYVGVLVLLVRLVVPAFGMAGFQLDLLLIHIVWILMSAMGIAAVCWTAYHAYLQEYLHLNILYWSGVATIPVAVLVRLNWRPFKDWFGRV